MAEKVMDEGIPASYVALALTSLPTIILISLVLGISNNNPLLFLCPFALIAYWILMKPVKECLFCKKKIIHKVVGPFDFHIQCGCVRDRWRPIWIYWGEQLHRKIFNQNEINR